jgi:hypothetical protein
MDCLSGRITSLAIMMVAMFQLTACGNDDDDDPSSYAVGGRISGLTGEGMVIQVNGGDDLNIIDNGAFAFPAKLSDGTSYEVTIANQPNDQSCTLHNGSGTLAGVDVTNVLISCPFGAVTPAVSAEGPKLLRFSWDDVGADHYRLLKNPDANAGYSQLGDDIAITSADEVISVHLTDWANVSYMVQACDVLGECVDSEPLAVTSLMLDVIGYMKASNIPAENRLGGRGDRYGGNVALSGDGTTLAVGASGDESLATGIDSDPGEDGGQAVGAVYLYVYEGGEWRQQAYIKASNSDLGDYFGLVQAISDDGNTLVIGSPGEGSASTGVNGDESDNTMASAGAVYVFSRHDGVWRQQAYIKSSNTAEGDEFGRQVTLSGDGDILGVLDKDLVYLFRRTGSDWAQQTVLEVSNSAYRNASGIASLELSSDGLTLAVGASEEDVVDNSVQGAGAVYIFVANGNGWTQQAHISAVNADSGDHFGKTLSLSASGELLAVGAENESSSATGVDGDSADNSAEYAGAVYLFERQDETWSQTAYLKASNTETYDFFGSQLILSGSGETLLVTARGEDSLARGIGGDQTDNSAQEKAPPGAVYLFRRRDGAWLQQAYIKASNTDDGYNHIYTSTCGTNPCWENDSFGNTIGISTDGDILAVGAPGENSGDPANQDDDTRELSGAVYLY